MQGKIGDRVCLPWVPSVLQALHAAAFWVLWNACEAQTVTQERDWVERVGPNANDRLSGNPAPLSCLCSISSRWCGVGTGISIRTHLAPLMSLYGYLEDRRLG